MAPIVPLLNMSHQQSQRMELSSSNSTAMPHDNNVSHAATVAVTESQGDVVSPNDGNVSYQKEKKALMTWKLILN
jgi:hypothetical protein